MYFELWARKQSEHVFERFESRIVKRKAGIGAISAIVKRAYGPEASIAPLDLTLYRCKGYRDLIREPGSGQALLRMFGGQRWSKATAALGLLWTEKEGTQLSSGEIKGAWLLMMGPSTGFHFKAKMLVEPLRHYPLIVFANSPTVNASAFTRFIRQHNIMQQSESLRQYYFAQRPGMANVLLQEANSIELVSIRKDNYDKASPEELFLLWYGLLSHLKDDAAVTEAFKALMPGCRVQVIASERGAANYPKDSRKLPYEILFLPRKDHAFRHEVPMFHWFSNDLSYMICINEQLAQIIELTDRRGGFYVPSKSHPECILLVSCEGACLDCNKANRDFLFKSAKRQQMPKAIVRTVAKTAH